MKRWITCAITAVALATVLACESADLSGLGKLLRQSSDGELTVETVTAGLKEALRVGTENAVEELSAEGGYLRNPDLRIGLPEKLQEVADTLRRIGLGGQVDALEQKMNAAAEEAAGQALPIFWDSIKAMTIEDAMGILRGGPTAATDYFRQTTYQPLKAEYEPVVEKRMEQLGLVRLYNDLLTRYEALPLVPQVDVKLEDYVTDRALDGLYATVAEEEQRIRENPAARTTELLRTVFGSQQ
jgi:hypothetical protein